MGEDPEPLRRLTRRDLVKLLPPAVAAGIAATALPNIVFAGHHLRPIDPALNPLASYPNRDWEDVYRDLYGVDRTNDAPFHYLCAPNDTHGCLLKAHSKNGVVKFIDPSYGYGKATDLYGNTCTARWDPRICPSGHAYLRRFYSDRRVKGAFVRQGFKDWVDAGMPRDANGLPPRSYYEGRGKEPFVKVPYADVFAMMARVYKNVAETYSGAAGGQRLLDQGYDPAMVDALHEAGTRTMKFRAGMPFLSAVRFTSSYRFAGMLALLDANVRGVTPAEAYGGRGWDNYAWHTDLPPGHPMVTGTKTSDFDLYTAEFANVITLWGMNWIATKMPDGHWISEARLRGAQVVTIATEYQSSSNKADEVIVIRPATDTALALACVHVLLRDGLYDADYARRFTDLPFLVRMDTRQMLRASDVTPGYTLGTLQNYITVLKPTDPMPVAEQQGTPLVPEALRNEWGDFVVWDRTAVGPRAITRDQVGTQFDAGGYDAALEGEFDVTLADGTTVVKARPVFDLVKQYVMDNFDPAAAAEICSTNPGPESSAALTAAIESFAALLGDPANRGKVLFTTGMGPNHYWNADLKDRAIFLLASLTGNEGRFGGEVGSYAGNYKAEVFSALPMWMSEDPFNITLDTTQPSKVKAYWKGESAHWYNYGDRPLRLGNKLFTGSTHMPTPTKTTWWLNTNSILGNAKWAHDVIMNTLPKIECITVNEWFWTATCEYSDIVLGVPSWIERKFADIYGSCTNPFLQTIVPTPIAYPFDLRDDLEMPAAVAQELGTLTGDARFGDYWRHVIDGQHEKYIQRVLDHSTATRGYDFQALLDSCRQGIPFYTLTRTSPRIVGWEQINESKPWYTKTGRMEFYREETEFLDAGENLPVWRETVDSTYYEPATIVAKPHPAIAPKQLIDWGIDPTDPQYIPAEVRQVRNLVMPWTALKTTKHPLNAADAQYNFILYTPKYRHACHSMAASQDISIVYFGPFGDFYRFDKRTPYVGEGYVDMNPADAKALGVEDGDYIWVEGDPADRPFRGWQGKPEDYRIFHWLVRARYYHNMPRRTARAWFHMHIATHGSVEGHETRADGLAKSPRTGYQAMYRYGSHQSVTRAWHKPTLMTDSLVRKAYYGQLIGKGFETDVHGAVGAPKESFVKISRAEAGGLGGTGLWRPAAEGFRPTYETAAVLKYLNGEYGG